MSSSPAHRLFAIAALCGAIAGFSPAGRAQTMALPAAAQFPLFAKILSYDRELARRANGEIVVGVLYQSRFHASLAAGDVIFSAIQNGSVRTISGIPVRAVLIDISGADDIESAIAASGANILYVTPLRMVDIVAVRAVCRSREMLSMTGVPEYVEQGIALGIDIQDERPLIMINGRCASEEGADLSSQLLKVAKLIP